MLQPQAKAMPPAPPSPLSSPLGSPTSAKSAALSQLVEAKKTLNQDLANIEQLEREKVFDKAEAAAQKKVVLVVGGGGGNGGAALSEYSWCF